MIRSSPNRFEASRPPSKDPPERRPLVVVSAHYAQVEQRAMKVAKETKTSSTAPSRRDRRRSRLVLVFAFLVGLVLGHVLFSPSIKKYSTKVVPSSQKKNDSISKKDSMAFDAGNTMTIVARDALPGGPKTHPKPNLQKNMQIRNFVVIPEYKLLFCYIQKTGCSMFNHLFRMLRLLHPSLPQAEAERLAKGYWDLNGPENHNLTLDDLEALLINPDWTKALFYRDPVARFLSGFRSKCGHIDLDGLQHCTKVFGQKAFDGYGSPDTFHDAVDDVLQKDTSHVLQDPHFKPMANFCGDLNATLDYYDFVHPLSSKTSPKLVHTLLRKIGVDTNTTDYLIENVVKSGGATDNDLQVIRELRNLTVNKGRSPKKHNTGTENGTTMRDYIGTEQRLNTIVEKYGMDYNLFQMPKPSFDKL